MGHPRVEYWGGEFESWADSGQVYLDKLVFAATKRFKSHKHPEFFGSPAGNVINMGPPRKIDIKGDSKESCLKNDF